MLFNYSFVFSILKDHFSLEYRNIRRFTKLYLFVFLLFLVNGIAAKLFDQTLDFIFRKYARRIMQHLTRLSNKTANSPPPPHELVCPDYFDRSFCNPACIQAC